MRKLQHEAEDYFRNLVDCFLEQYGDQRGVHKLVLDNVLMPGATIATFRAEGFAGAKKESLLELIGDEEQMNKQLVHLFWSSSMQKLVASKTARRDSVELTGDEKAHCDELTQESLTWALQPEIRDHKEMDGSHLGTFMRDLEHLKLICDFSDPKCFLHPCVGQEVRYSPGHHSLKHPGRCGKKVSAGQKVHVLYPGLYFAHPETEERGSPITALVMYFD